jgi:hypothetical protein
VKHFKETDSGDMLIDISKVSRGTYIEPDEIAETFGLAKTSSHFAFKVMSLCQDIEKTTLDDGDPMLARCEGYGIRVMTDEEALDYLNRRFWQHTLAMSRIEQRFNNIRVKGLSSELQGRKERQQYAMSRINGSISDTKKQLGAIETPALNE